MLRNASHTRGFLAIILLLFASETELNLCEEEA